FDTFTIRSSSPGDHSNRETHRATVRLPVNVVKTPIIDEPVHTSSAPVGREACSTGWADCRLPQAQSRPCRDAYSPAARCHRAAVWIGPDRWLRPLASPAHPRSNGSIRGHATRRSATRLETRIAARLG